MATNKFPLKTPTSPPRSASGSTLSLQFLQLFVDVLHVVLLDLDLGGMPEQWGGHGVKDKSTRKTPTIANPAM